MGGTATGVRAATEHIESLTLAHWATHSASTKGRQTPEPDDELRTAFQRDRDRVLHTKAFRRLMHKTQVFLAPEGDHYRTRLTHTLEVAQVARTICRGLRLNEDLVEAICLAHDLGHTPFGHMGEEVLAGCLGRPFEHNRQSLRVVDVLERDGRGLNLTWEVRDGVLNHTWRMPEPSTPEGLVARWADRIAYVNHDVDDAIRAGVLSEAELPPDVLDVLGATHRQRLDTLVRSVVGESAAAGAVRMPAEQAEAMAVLRQFLFERVYLGPAARGEQVKAGEILRALFEHYARHPDLLPDSPGNAGDDLPQRVADYVSGMTDRFAIRTFSRLFVPESVS
ncbi:MAG TPA: deoxyguanosinetriphosphate triphosphohydrolase [Actinomycetota bacterium]|nr:deoxyguanosinetriphosphate triphosphohydrolase [Actinomycetota bacterium]